MDCNATEISLMEAAHRLRVSYNRALRLVLTGALDGNKKDGNWVVSAESVERVQEKG